MVKFIEKKSSLAIIFSLNKFIYFCSTSYPHFVFILNFSVLGGIEQKPKSCFSTLLHF